MAWDQALLRKFSSTGHFRLLNQVRSELKSQPLNRDAQTRKLVLQARPHHGQSVRQQRRPNPVPEDQPILTLEETTKDISSAPSAKNHSFSESGVGGLLTGPALRPISRLSIQSRPALALRYSLFLSLSFSPVISSSPVFPTVPHGSVSSLMLMGAHKLAEATSISYYASLLPCKSVHPA